LEQLRPNLAVNADAAGGAFATPRGLIFHTEQWYRIRAELSRHEMNSITRSMNLTARSPIMPTSTFSLP